MTNNYNNPPEPSVTKVSNGVKGYPEISYFKSEFMDPQIKGTDHEARFKDIKMYVSTKEMGVNYEHLLNLTDGYMNASLYNLQNVYMMLELAGNTPDIIEDPTQKLDLTAWTDLKKNLLLQSEEQVYLIYLWFKYAEKETIDRLSLGGSRADFLIGKWAGGGVSSYLNTMEIEIPVIVYAYEMEADYKANGLGCTLYSTTILGVPTLTAGIICTFSDFDWTDPITTAKNWMDLWLNQNIVLWEEFATAANYTDTQMNTFLYDPKSFMWQYVTGTLMTNVYNQYNETICKSDLSVQLYCTPKQLAIAQWLNGDVLNSPTKAMPQETKGMNYSYQKYYSNFTSLDYTPELFYFVYRAEINQPKITINDTWTYMNPQMMFNGGVNMELLYNSTFDIPFNVPSYKKYMKFIAQNHILQGFFI